MSACRRSAQSIHFSCSLSASLSQIGASLKKEPPDQTANSTACSLRRKEHAVLFARKAITHMNELLFKNRHNLHDFVRVAQGVVEMEKCLQLLRSRVVFCTTCFTSLMVGGFLTGGMISVGLCGLCERRPYHTSFYNKNSIPVRSALFGEKMPISDSSGIRGEGGAVLTAGEITEC